MSSSFFLVLRRPPLPLLAFGRRPLSRRSEETSLRPRASSAMENGTSQAAAAATTSRLRLPPADRGVAPDDRVQRTNRKRVVGQSFGGVASVAWTTKIRERKLAPRARAAVAVLALPLLLLLMPNRRRGTAHAAAAAAAFARRLHLFARYCRYPLKRQPVSLFGFNRASRLEVQQRSSLVFGRFTIVPIARCPSGSPLRWRRRHQPPLDDDVFDALP